MTEECFIETVLRQRSRWCYSVQSRGFDDATAEDIVSNAVARGWEHRHLFRGESSPDVWMFRIVMNSMYDYLRKRKARLQPDCIDLVDIPDEAISRPETSSRRMLFKQVMAYVDQLPSAQRSAVDIYLSGAGSPSSEIRVRMFRAVRQLRKLLAAPHQSLS